MIHFTWHGSDEGTEVWAEGWVELENAGLVEGEVSFPEGDKTSLTARRW